MLSLWLNILCQFKVIAAFRAFDVPKCTPFELMEKLPFVLVACKNLILIVKEAALS